MAIYSEQEGVIQFDRYPWFARGLLTAAFLVAAIVVMFSPEQFPMGVSLIPLAVSAICWMMEWRVSFHLNAKQIRLRRGFRELTKESILKYDDVKAIRIDFHPAEARNAESYSISLEFKYGGLVDFKLKTFTTLQAAVDEAASLFASTGIPVTESDELMKRHQAFIEVGELIKDSKENQHLKA